MRRRRECREFAMSSEGDFPPAREPLGLWFKRQQPTSNAGYPAAATSTGGAAKVAELEQLS